MSDQLPDGWVRIDESRYSKLVKRDAVTVPKRRKGEGFTRDCVVVITDDLAGVVQGPGARQSWRVADPEAVAHRLADTLDAWVADGGDPYGGSDLNTRLDAAAMAETTTQTKLAEPNQ